MKWLRPVSILVAAGLIVLAVIGADIVGEMQTARKLEAAREAVRKEGFPASADDLRRLLPKPPEDQNAAPLYREVISQWRRLPSRGAFSAGATPPSPAAEAAALRDLGPMLDRAVAASRRPYCHWDREWEQGFGLLLPEYADLKSIGRTLVRRAVVRAKGDPDGAFRDLVGAARIGQHLGQEPIIIAQMVRVGMERRVADGLGRVLDAVPNPQTKKEDALAVVEALGPAVPLKFWLASDIAAYMIWVDRERSLGTSAFVGEMGLPSISIRQRIGMMPMIRRGYFNAVAEASTEAAQALASAGTDPRKISEALVRRDEQVAQSVARWEDSLLMMVSGGDWRQTASLAQQDAQVRTDLRQEVLRRTGG